MNKLFQFPAALIIAAAFLLNFQSFSQGLNARYIKTNTKEFPNNTVTALLVYDNYGSAVKGLDKSAFTTILDGKKGDISGVSTMASTGKGIYTVLCIDVSGSMRGKPMEDSKAAVLRYINELGDKDYVAIYSYGDGADLVADFSNDKGYLTGQVKKLTAKDQYTSLFYGASKGIEKLKDKAKEDEAVNLVLIGDGNNDSPTDAYTIDDVIFKAKEAGVPVFTFGYTSSNKMALQNLEKIGDETGGRYYESPNREELDNNFRKMRDNIHNIYLVAYKVYELEGKGQEVNGIFTVKQGQLTSEVSGKVKLPAAKASAKPEDGDGGLGVWGLVLGVGVLVLAGGVLVFVIMNGKKKKRLAEATERELEALRAAEPPVVRDEPAPGRRTAIEELPPTMVEMPDQSPDATVIMRPGAGGSAAGTARLVLEVKIGPLAGKEFAVTAAGAVIGRSPQEATLVLAEPGVSKKHARVSFRDGRYFIEDLGSSNGVFVNMKRITHAVEITDGNSFKMGGCEGYFRIR